MADTSGSRPPLRLFLGAFGDPGHAFPMIALGRALVDRGHEVMMQTSSRWRSWAQDEGLTFADAPEYHAYPDRPRPLKPYEAALRAAREMEPLLKQFAPDAVVADILTLGPALAGEMVGAKVATLIPHIYPVAGPSFPIYSIGARLPRTTVGRRLWQLLSVVPEKGLAQGRDELNETRRRLGLDPVDRFHGGISAQLTLVGTFPALEYPRAWPAHVHVVGPLMWEPPADDVELPPGDGPLVLVAPSTSQDPDHRMLEAALEGLADAPMRVLATWNRRPPGRVLPMAANIRLVEWVSYARTMPLCDVVVCHAGHGTLVRALSSGCSVVACPVAGDMNENASRIDWARVGVRVPARYVHPRPLRRAVERALADRERRQRARGLAAWASQNDSAGRAAALVEELARAES